MSSVALQNCYDKSLFWEDIKAKVLKWSKYNLGDLERRSLKIGKWKYIIKTFVQMCENYHHGQLRMKHQSHSNPRHLSAPSTRKCRAWRLGDPPTESTNTSCPSTSCSCNGCPRTPDQSAIKAWWNAPQILRLCQPVMSDHATTPPSLFWWHHSCRICWNPTHWDSCNMVCSHPGNIIPSPIRFQRLYGGTWSSVWG